MTYKQWQAHSEIHECENNIYYYIYKKPDRLSYFFQLAGH